MYTIISLFLVGLLVILALVLLASFPTMLLWNWLMPEIFGLPEIGFLQALGLMVLSTFFFYRGAGGSGK